METVMIIAQFKVFIILFESKLKAKLIKKKSEISKIRNIV